MIVLVDYTAAARHYFDSATAHGAWSGEAQDYAERVQQTIVWDERIEAVIRFGGLGRRHVLTLSFKARDKLFGMSVDLMRWQSQNFDPCMLVCAFRDLVCKAMFELQTDPVVKVEFDEPTEEQRRKRELVGRATISVCYLCGSSPAHEPVCKICHDNALFEAELGDEA